MEKFPATVWAGTFDPQLHGLIRVFATSTPQNLPEVSLRAWTALPLAQD